MGGRRPELPPALPIDDYEQGVIKKHENTREEKEQDRINHVDICNAQTAPFSLHTVRMRLSMP